MSTPNSPTKRWKLPRILTRNLPRNSPGTIQSANKAAAQLIMGIALPGFNMPILSPHAEVEEVPTEPFMPAGKLDESRRGVI